MRLDRFAVLSTILLGGMLLASDAALAGVLVVGGGGSYLSIQAAVNAATDGDIVLVKSGAYFGFTIDGLGISVVGDAGAVVGTNGPVTVKNLTAGQRVALVRLTMQGAVGGTETDGVGLRVNDCLGHVRVEYCTIRGFDGAPLVGCTVLGQKNAFAAMRVRNCSDVALTLGDLRGGTAKNLFDFPGCDGEPISGGTGGSALDVSDARLSVYDSVLAAGDGGTAWYYGGDAGDACHLVEQPGVGVVTEMFASNVIFDGEAKGGDAWDYFGSPEPGTGGNAIESIGNCTVRTLDCALISGKGGCSLAGCLGLAPPVIGGLANLLGESKGLGAPRVLREGQTAPFVFQGQPGDATYLLLSPDMGSVFVPTLRGQFLLGSALFGPVALGTIPAAGSFSLPLAVPALPAGVLGASVELQAIMVSPQGSGTLTSSVHVTLLSATL